MLSHKRKRVAQSDDESDSSGYSIAKAASDDEIDISAALAGKKPKSTGKGKQRALEVDDLDDEDLHDIIQDSIAKRNVKGGTDVLKKTKGKVKLAKGEVGGGSFQSMGAYHRLSFKKLH